MEKIQLKTKDQSRALLIGSIIIGLIILVTGFFVLVKPAIGDYKTIQSELAENKNKITEVKETNNNLRALNAGYQDIIKNEQDFVNKIDFMIPEKTSSEDLFPAIENLVSRNGLLLTSISVKRNEKAKVNNKNLDGLGEDVISLDVVGVDYLGVKNFLKVLENDLRLKDIQALSFSLTDYTMHLEIKTYFLNQSKIHDNRIK